MTMPPNPPDALERRRSKRPLIVLLPLLVLSSQVGCLPMIANLGHMVGADMVPAQYEDLEDSRIAIVTSTASTNYKEDLSAQILSRNVGALLTQKVDDVRLVRQSEIDKYRDRAGWEDDDMVALGKAVEADKVVAIELKDLTLREGITMFHGRSTVEIVVYDVATGDELFRRDIDEYTYPRNAGQPSTETTESAFRKLYLGMLAKEVARTFHPYDFSDTFALDGAIASH